MHPHRNALERGVGHTPGWMRVERGRRPHISRVGEVVGGRVEEGPDRAGGRHDGQHDESE